MTPSQATEIVRRLHAAYPHPPMTPDRTKLLIDEIALLANPDTAAEATRNIIRNSQYFPTIAEFRTAYHTTSQRQREATVRLEEPPRADEPPRWVQVWTWARWMRDPREVRAFPQERSGFNSSVTNGDNAPAYLTHHEYEQLEREWAQAGSPKWKPTEILRTAGIAR